MLVQFAVFVVASRCSWSGSSHGTVPSFLVAADFGLFTDVSSFATAERLGHTHHKVVRQTHHKHNAIKHRTVRRKVVEMKEPKEKEEKEPKVEEEPKVEKETKEEKEPEEPSIDEDTSDEPSEEEETPKIKSVKADDVEDDDATPEEEEAPKVKTPKSTPETDVEAEARTIVLTDSTTDEVATSEDEGEAADDLQE